MKENADIDQSKLNVRNPDWILILGVEPHRKCEFLNVTSQISPSNSRVPPKQN